MSRTPRDAGARAAHPILPAMTSRRRRGVWLVAALAAAATLLVILGTRTPIAGADTSIQTYSLPDGPVGTGLVTAPDGTVWFATGDSSAPQPRIGRLDPASAQPGTSAGISLYSTPTFTGAPCCATMVRSLAYDPASNNVWFARSDGMYGYGRTGDMVAGTANGFSWNTVSYQNGASTGYIGLWGIAYDPVTKQAWLLQNTTDQRRVQPGLLRRGAGRHRQRARLSEGRTSPCRVVAPPSRVCATTPSRAASRSVPTDRRGSPSPISGNPGWRIAHTNGTGDYGIPHQPCVGTPCSGSTGTGPTDTTVAPTARCGSPTSSIGPSDVWTPSAAFTTYTLASISPARHRPAMRSARRSTARCGSRVRRHQRPGAKDVGSFLAARSHRDGVPDRASARCRSRRARPVTCGSVSTPRPAQDRSGDCRVSSGAAHQGRPRRPPRHPDDPGTRCHHAHPERRRRRAPRAVVTSGDTTSVTQICVGPPRTDAAWSI